MDLVFIQSLTEICQRSMVSPGRPLACTIIVNPAAGGFTIPSKWKSHVQILSEYRQKAQANPIRDMYKRINMDITDGKGSGEKITKSVIARAEKNPEPFYLIITTGGDGTHLETLFALYDAPAHVRSNIAVLRLPLGTGNDGADGTHLAEALDLLVKPVRIEFTPAVQLITAPGGPASEGGPYLAFNILSVGLDAFVTHMTNKMKNKVPGDSYRLWVDVASLFYDCVYKVGFLDVRALDEQNREIRSFREKMLLLAMGVSGHRTYGSQNRILPDDRNVCGLKQMSVFRKLTVKGQVAKGTHANNPESILFNAARLEFSGSHPILAQMDGETVLLQPEDFPATMELTAPVIPLLKLSV
jgi:diacylglycerol kinase family enzyme